MSLTIKSFFSNFILKPWEAKSSKEKALAWTGSILLAFATACTIHVGCALVKYAIVPIADKTGLTAKIDELRDRYFPDTTSAEEKRTEKGASKKTLDSSNVTPLTKEQGKALTKGKKQVIVKTVAPKTAKKEEEDIMPVPQDWSKAEANLRKSADKEDIYITALLDIPKFREGCKAAANLFLEDRGPTPKEKIQAFHTEWTALISDPESRPPGKMPDSYRTNTCIALCFVLHETLEEEKFVTFQNWFLKDHGFDPMKNDNKEYFLWSHIRLGFGAAHWQETQNL